MGYEGAYELLHEGLDTWPGWMDTPDDLREALKKRKLTPWSKRDKAADRGTWVHDVLEALAQRGEVSDLDSFSEEARGHAQAVLKWYLDFRPEFLATEVQVVSEEHRYAGRYDIRARLEPEKLCLIDLKTSKSVYPTSHFPQLAGYELASVEMGYPSTDAQYVLNTHPDGTYDFVWSVATGEDFLAYLGALKAIRRIKAASK